MSVFASIGADYVVPVLNDVIEQLRASSGTLSYVSEQFTKWRGSFVTDAIRMGVFLGLARNEILRGPTLYELLFSEKSLAPWRRGGVTNGHIALVQRAIFFYLLYLFYQLVRFPLLLGPPNFFKDAFDVVVQSVLLVSVLWRLSSVVRSLNVRHQDDDERRGRVEQWLDGQFRSMGMAYSTLIWRTVAIFAAGTLLAIGSIASPLTQELVWALEVLKDMLT